MNITIKKKALLYDIENIAYVIADNGVAGHSPHRVFDICRKGNIDRVARILGLAYAKVQYVLSPLLEVPPMFRDFDFSVIPRNYRFRFKCGLPAEKILKIKETVHEYMVCMVLADWLGITMPAEAKVWEERAAVCLNELAGSSIISGVMTRQVPPI